MDAGEMMPVRLVQESGETISLDATSVDIIVERIQSSFAIPFFDAKRMGIDLNQASVTIEIQGVLTDDTGQSPSSKAVATLDFYQPQTIVSWGQPVNGGGGGNNAGPVASAFNMAGPAGNSVAGVTTGIGGSVGNTGGFAGGLGGSSGGFPLEPSDLGNRILQYWAKKYIDLPVAYWTEAGQSLDNPVKTGLQLWLKADSITGIAEGGGVATWTDSSGNGRNVGQTTSSKQPLFSSSRLGSSLIFDGTNDEMQVLHSPFFNSEEFTIFTVSKSSKASGTQPIVSSVESGKGYALSKNMTTKEGVALWRDAGGDDSITSATDPINNTDAHILTYTMDDTTGSADADTATLFVNGKQEVQQTSGVGYIPNLSAALKVGVLASDFFQGEIAEILIYNSVLSDENREQVEGYLSFKYGIGLDFTHEYAGVGARAHESKHVRVTFDDLMVASKNEPYGFSNIQRNTSMTVQSFSSTTITVTGNLPVGSHQYSSGSEASEPHDWFEPTENGRNQRIIFKRGNSFVDNATETDILYATVLTVNATEITYRLDTPGTIANSDEIYIAPIQYADTNLQGRSGSPVIVVPIKNADTFNEFAAPEAAVGPSFPTYEDGSPRDTGGGLTRTDEYLTYLISKAATASYIDVNREVDASSNETMDKVFSVDISESYHGHNCRLTITQQYASSLGQSSDTINTTLGVGQMPVTQGFSGGKSGTAGSNSGRPIKSGGDKAQDLLGILANSNNYARNANVGLVGDFLSAGKDFITNQVNPQDAVGDYIRGIQIPYLTHVTKGKNSLDSHIAQRNFFLTTEGETADKVSSINTEHASRLFSHTYEGHLKNGISGLVADMTIHREAEHKAYDFNLMFIAADIIL